MQFYQRANSYIILNDGTLSTVKNSGRAIKGILCYQYYST